MIHRWIGAALLLCPTLARADAIDRLKPERLEAVHRAIEEGKKDWRKVEPLTPLVDHRAILHLHSKWSHDSRGTIENIVAAAKSVGVSVLMFTEHPADHYDFVLDGHQGVKDGVLLIPGAESTGLLLYPNKTIKGVPVGTPQELVDLVKRHDGLSFLCHLEERMDWELAGLTGSEIYNTHADVKSERRFMSSLRNPLTWFTLVPAVQKFPQETYASLQDYPADYLKRYDELCLRYPHTGVAANDAHQNIGMRVVLLEGGKMRVEDALGEKLVELDGNRFPLLAPRAKDKKPGEVIFELRLDPYERAFHYVSTHLFLDEHTKEGVWKALKGGRAYVSFDWLADPTGFCFVADRKGERKLMGSEVVFQKGSLLKVVAPRSGKIKLLREGEVVMTKEDRSLEYPLDRPGIYRAEIWLKIADEDRPWILSNPLYVRVPH